MALPTTIEQFSRAYISKVMDELTQEREERPLFFLDQVQEVEALDSEVFLYTGNRIIASDIIQLDQKARVTRTVDTYRVASTTVPKFKHGFHIDENMMATLLRLENGAASMREMGRFDAYVADKLRRLLSGIRERQELVLSQLFLNTGSYDRLGIMFDSYNWGVLDTNLGAPTPLAGAAQWTIANQATCTPIANVQAWQDYQRNTYGGRYDSILLDETTLNNIIASTEFQTVGQVVVAGLLGRPRDTMSGMIYNAMTYEAKAAAVGAVMGLTVHVRSPYKQKTLTENENGGTTEVNFWDDTQVLLYDSTIFSADSLDFANCEVFETYPGQVPLMLGADFASESSGPIAYATAADPHGNPPGQYLWAVKRGWYRLHKHNKKIAVKVRP